MLDFQSPFKVIESNNEPPHHKPQADLSLRRAHSHFVGFTVMRRLKSEVREWSIQRKKKNILSPKCRSWNI